MDCRDRGRNSGLRFRNLWQSCSSILSRRTSSVATLSSALAVVGRYEFRVLVFPTGRSLGTRGDQILPLRSGILARTASVELGAGCQPSLVAVLAPSCRLVQSDCSQFSAFRNRCASVLTQLGQLSFCVDSGDACSLRPMGGANLWWIGNLRIRSTTETDVRIGDSMA